MLSLLQHSDGDTSNFRTRHAFQEVKLTTVDSDQVDPADQELFNGFTITSSYIN